MSATGLRNVPAHLHVVAGMGRTSFFDVEGFTVGEATKAGSRLLVLDSDAHSYTKLDMYRVRKSSPIVDLLCGTDPRFAKTGATLLEVATVHEGASDVEAPMTVSSQLDPKLLADVEFDIQSQLRINTKGIASDVHKVVAALRRFFGDARIQLAWQEGGVSEKPVTLTVFGPEDVDEAFERLDRFDEEWWYRQEARLRQLVAIHLA